jgi:hypothetical protein
MRRIIEILDCPTLIIGIALFILFGLTFMS